MNWVPWGVPSSEALEVQNPFDVQPRSAADYVYAAPGLTAFRQTDSLPLPTREDGEETPRPRTFLRRFLGAACRDLTAAIRTADEMPPLLTPGRVARAEGKTHENLVRLALAQSGIYLPNDTPMQALTSLHALLPKLRPLGRTETFLSAFEACMGAGTRSRREERHWTHESASSSGASITVSTALIDLDPPDVLVGSQFVFITLDGPDYLVGVLKAMRCGAFSTPIHRVRHDLPLWEGLP